MVERLEIQNRHTEKLKKELEGINWQVDHGSVKMQIRNGKATLITIERTIKLD